MKRWNLSRDERVRKGAWGENSLMTWLERNGQLRNMEGPRSPKNGKHRRHAMEDSLDRSARLGEGWGTSRGVRRASAGRPRLKVTGNLWLPKLLAGGEPIL